MDANGFGLLSSISEILNSRKRDSDYAIARYLVPRLDNLRSLMITDITENAFVTRSAVRRFCNKLGFSSFSELKSQVTTAAYPSDLNHRDLQENVVEYRASLDGGIEDMLSEMGRTVNNDQVVALSRSLHDHAGVVLVCANNTSGTLVRFQQELFYAQKFIQLATDSYRTRLVESTDDEDRLVVVVSASGVFARNIESWISEIESEKYLITANPAAVRIDDYDRTYCLNCSPIDHDSWGLFGKYGMTYFFDLLSACYLHLYGA
ncbi:MurR/RpiR family transcriptional regulator [Thermophilibacter immobilis]|uniref:MurR/RpiR family transcriptional regulator n=1 Tax=Thermophilibacter immobilis TaxID=2779519 RepID=A0A7S7M862_9ACTN|nr:MurR/RpiR family transcriptional regulator [Thermophilibacter immobilis]QOY60546.1 MurR/RpiR family transcriptional regulator [Thermophilibacter immobilis]